MREPGQEKELRAGDFVTNGVRLLRPLAEGGMGRVWIAEHLGLRTEVVVKLMAKEMMERPDGATRFAREAAIAAAIKSPHVVQVFDHGIAAQHDVPYIVMERLEGRDLGHVLGDRGRLEPTEAAAVIVQIGRALSKAHKAGIVHRDIKPENIFLCTPDTDCGSDSAILAKLLDFGTAKRDQHASSPSATLPGEIMGTPYYMSPEQSVGAMLDERTDIWSLGVVAFEALTGEKPFEGSNVGAIALAIHGPTPKLSDRVADLPPALDAWFAKACALVPQDRFATTREMTAAFVEALTGATPVMEATESLVLPPRRISVRPESNDDMRKTVVTSIEPSIPPPPAPKPVQRSFTGSIEVEMDSLAATLPDHKSAQRPAKIALMVVGLAAAGMMAGILMANRANPSATTTTTAAEPPPVTQPAPEPVATRELPLPPSPMDIQTAPPPAAHKKTAHKKHSATAKKDEDADLTRLIKANDTEAKAPEPEAAKPEPKAEAQSLKPEAANTSKPEAAKPEPAKPEAAKPEAAKPPLPPTPAPTAPPVTQPSSPPAAK